MSGMSMDPMATAQGMFGGFGGPGMGMANMNGMNGMTGMNVGMNFNANQGGFGGWNGQNNMWNGPQNNNNPNAFPNGMGDFGSTSGYGGFNMPQHQGNFQQMNPQQYSNNDYQGSYGQSYGRGRGRGRGRGFGYQGRGGYGQNQGNYANNQNYNQQQYQYQHSQPQQEEQQEEQPSGKDEFGRDLRNESVSGTMDEDQLKKFNDELAPGGGDDTEDALEDGAAEVKPSAEEALKAQTTSTGTEAGDGQEEPYEPAPAQDNEGSQQLQPVQSVLAESSPGKSYRTSSIPTASVDQFTTPVDTPMPPPTAPLGPAAQYGGGENFRDYGIRGRGRSGSYRGRGGSVSLPNGHGYSSPAASATPEVAHIAPTEPKGLGVVGAPTGPKAMRAGLPNTGIRGRGGCFQIVGRASMASQAGSRGSERSRRYILPLCTGHRG